MLGLSRRSPEDSRLESRASASIRPSGVQKKHLMSWEAWLLWFTGADVYSALLPKTRIANQHYILKSPLQYSISARSATLDQLLLKMKSLTTALMKILEEANETPGKTHPLGHRSTLSVEVLYLWGSSFRNRLQVLGVCKMRSQPIPFLLPRCRSGKSQPGIHETLNCQA